MRVDVADVDVPAATLPGEAVIDFAVEAAVLFAVNVVLPGGWLEALIARVLGKKLLDKVTEPLKGAVRGLAKQLLGGVIRSTLAGQLRDAIGNACDEFGTRIHDQVDVVLRRVEADAVTGLDERLRGFAAAANEARGAKHAGEAQAAERRRRVELVATAVDDLLRETTAAR